MDQHVQAGSVYPSDGGETTQNSKITVLDQSPETFLKSLFDRRVYDIGATENAAIGLFDRLAHPWPNTSVEPSDTHFAGALFEVNTVDVARDGFRRNKERWTGQVAVVLDDVGSKAKRPPVMPTAIIETRPGNEQWVYAFNRIERDPALIETILQSAIAGGITDPEAGGITRITRLPGSLPKGKPHRAKLIWADWSRRFNPDVLIEKGFQVARVTPAAPAPVGELRLSDETTTEGRGDLERACQAIRDAKPGRIANTINAQAYFIGQRVGAGLIALEEAEAALLSAAGLYDRGEGHARNGLRDGIQRPIARDEAGQEIEPFHPAPDEDRDAAIDAHPATIRAWADRNIPIMQATKAVARAYAEIGDDEDQGPKEKAKAKRAIRRRIRDQFDLDFLPASKITKKAPITRAMLSGAQGVGKTRAVVGADGNAGILHQTQGLVSVLFEPDHGMVAQAKRDYDTNATEGSPPSIHVWGRGSPDPDQPDETMCRLPEIATALAQKGVSVRQALCENCPYADVCGYLRQEAEIASLAAAPEGVALFAPHDYAFLPLPSLIEPDLAIFDERPRDNGVGDDVGLSFDDLSQTLRFDRPLKAQSATQTTHEEADAQAANLRFIRPLQVALRDAGQDHPTRILAALRDRGIDQAHVKGAIAGLKYFRDRETAHAMRNVMGQWTFAQMSGHPFNLQSRLEREIEQRDGKAARDLQTIFEALLIEIDKDRDDAIGIEVGDVTRNGRTSKGIVAVKLKRLRLGRVPFLHLDGTGDHGMAQMIFGTMDHAEHRVERSPAGRRDRIIQVVGTDFHNAGLIGGRKGKDGAIEPFTGTWADRYDAQRRDVQKIIADRPGALVVGNKRAIAALKPEEHGAHSAHFAAIRGRNDWSKINTVVVVGREQPSPAAVERIARAYAAHGDADFESIGSNRYPETTRGIRKRDGTGHPVKVAYHPNAWADRVLRSIRDTEIEQTIDRIRPIFKEQPIEVILMSPVAVDLTVDQVVSWSQFRQGGTRVERALKLARIVPLSGREAARLVPEVWANRTTAQEDLSEAGLLAISLNREPYLQILPIRIGVVATYKTEVEAGKRSREQRVLIAAPPAEARAVLEARTGPLREFQVVKVFEPDQAAIDAAEAREERIAIAMHDGGLSEVEAAKVADRIETPEQVEPKAPDQVEILPDIAKPERRRRSRT